MGSLTGKLGGNVSAECAGLLAGQSDIRVWAEDLKDQLNTVEGGSAVRAWVVDSETVTLAEDEPVEDVFITTAASVSELWSGGASLAEADTGLQPRYFASGGPAGRPYISRDVVDAARRLVATVSLSAGHVTGLYIVGRTSAGAVARLVEVVGGGGDVAVVERPGVNLLRFYLDFDSGGPDFVSETSADGQWRVLSMQVTVADAASAKIDGVAVDPNFLLGFEGLKAATTVAFGSAAAELAWGGDLAALLLVNNATAAKDTIVRQALRSRFGVP